MALERTQPGAGAGAGALRWTIRVGGRLYYTKAGCDSSVTNDDACDVPDGPGWQAAAYGTQPGGVRV